MKSPRKWLVSLTLVILLSGFGWSVYAQKQKMARMVWEYKETTNGGQLNELGAQGWVSAVFDQGAHTRIYTLKRAK